MSGVIHTLENLGPVIVEPSLERVMLSVREGYCQHFSELDVRVFQLISADPLLRPKHMHGPTEMALQFNHDEEHDFDWFKWVWRLDQPGAHFHHTLHRSLLGFIDLRNACFEPFLMQAAKWAKREMTSLITHVDGFSLWRDSVHGGFPKAEFRDFSGDPGQLFHHLIDLHMVRLELTPFSMKPDTIPREEETPHQPPPAGNDGIQAADPGVS